MPQRATTSSGCVSSSPLRLSSMQSLTSSGTTSLGVHHTRVAAPTAPKPYRSVAAIRSARRYWVNRFFLRQLVHEVLYAALHEV